MLLVEHNFGRTDGKPLTQKAQIAQTAAENDCDPERLGRLATADSTRERGSENTNSEWLRPG
jgi:hypothetical protein